METPTVKLGLPIMCESCEKNVIMPLRGKMSGFGLSLCTQFKLATLNSAF